MSDDERVDPANVTGRSAGKSVRADVPRSSHGEWIPEADRPDPVEVITSQDGDRLRFLVPIRHWRMSESPFTFYRGAAKLMAQDLSSTPVTGMTTQICGDAHLSNFGLFGSPERSLVFDVNDFDETHPGPWEWDVKRLAASLSIAARNNELDSSDQEALAAGAAQSYVDAMARFAEMGYLQAWYSKLRAEDIRAAFADQLSKKDERRGDKIFNKARSKDSLAALGKLGEVVDGHYRIVSRPPLVVPARDMPAEYRPTDLEATVTETLDAYLRSVPDHLEFLLRRFTIRDIGLKVVGVGSVGTRCFILLLEGRDAQDPFILQIKQAERSVLEEFLPKGRYRSQGQRVVVGQRLMQASSDSFLGWTKSPAGYHFYVRQLKDMKGSIDIEALPRDALRRYASLCGWTLARAHARSGHAAAISGYLGKGKTFSEAIGRFSMLYADQNELDFAAFTDAIKDGRIEAHE